jgi:3-dehydroquinate synthase
MRTVWVELRDRSYPVYIGAGLMADLLELVPSFPEAERYLVLTDRNVEPLYAARVEEKLGSRGAVERLVVGAGEESKNLQVAWRLLHELTAREARRFDVFVTLGGGMISDLGGFVASLYQRGMPLIHLPTTVEGQVDAAIGGKTGVNLAAGKNLVGTFYQPDAVIADVTTLSTLPEREFRSGLAEVVKYGLVLDPDLLDLVVRSSKALSDRDEVTLEEIVERCASLKAGVIAADERDFSQRIVLNYGHTLAHALEAASYGRFLHGEAVSVGMAYAAALAHEIGVLGADSVERHLSSLEALELPTVAEFEPDELMKIWSIDKKYRRGQRWVLLKSLGEAVVESQIDEAAVRRALDRVRAR